MSKYCEKCGLMLVTPEAQAVLDISVEYRTKPSFTTFETFAKVIDAYRASLRPKPRYYVDKHLPGGFDRVLDRTMGETQNIVASCPTRDIADKIAAALNAAEEK